MGLISKGESIKTDEIASVLAEQLSSKISVNNTAIIYKEETTKQVIDFSTESVKANNIIFLVNDGEKAIKLTLTIGTSSTIITLKTGEGINDLPITLDSMTVEPKVTGDSIAWRYLGGVK